jgi:hypothetical protein
VIPYTVLEETHLQAGQLDALKLIILPRCTALPRAAMAALSDWARAGGTLLCEAESGAFTEDGLYHPGEERWLADLAGLVDVGRRELAEGEQGELSLDGTRVTLAVDQWSTPYRLPDGATTYGSIADGSLLTKAPAGRGQVIALGSYAAGEGLGDLVRWAAAQAGVAARIRVQTANVHLRTGLSQGRRLLFVFAEPDCERVDLELDQDLLSGVTLSDLRHGHQVRPTASDSGWNLQLPIPPIGLSILAEDPV